MARQPIRMRWVYITSHVSRWPFHYLRRMKKFIALLLASVVALTISAQQQVKTPAEIYGELFTDVQMRHVFPDSKTFADCIPKRDPTQIVKDYLAMKSDPNIRFKLDEFVTGNFDLPKAPQLNYITKEKDCLLYTSDAA